MSQYISQGLRSSESKDVRMVQFICAGLNFGEGGRWH